MSSFFTTPASQRKRKRGDAAGAGASKRGTSTSAPSSGKPRNRPERDESISGSESGSEDAGVDSDEQDDSSGSEHEDETAAERRLRLAERYLDNIKEEVNDVGFDAEQIDKDLIAERLQEDVAESKGQLYRLIASQLDLEATTSTFFRADTLATNSIATSSPYVYTVSKDATLIKWRIPEHTTKTGKANPRTRPKQVKYVKGQKVDKRGHASAILCVAASEDGKFVVTGGEDKKLVIWDAKTLSPLKVCYQHRDAVTALAFRSGTNMLFSASKDRTVKVWSLNELAYVETLFGHQDVVVDIAGVGAQERCLSVGARDRTARLWKIVDETQLVFRGGGGGGKKAESAGADQSIDCVASIDTNTFVTGSSSGSLSLWQIAKKKPMHTIALAHGSDPAPTLEESFAGAVPPPELDKPISPERPRWITALATVPFADLVVSGSWDGTIRAWRVAEDKRRLEPVGQVAAVRGVVNALAAYAPSDRTTSYEGVSSAKSPSASPAEVVVAVALGKEHKFGRWLNRGKEKGKNGAVIIKIPLKKDNGVALDIGSEK